MNVKYQENPMTPYRTTNPHLNNPLKGVSLDTSSSKCAQQLLLKTFSGGSKSKKYKKSKIYKKSKKYKKNKKSKNSIKKINKILKGGSADTNECNHTGASILDSGAKKSSIIRPTGFIMHATQKPWSYKPRGDDGEHKDFITHHLTTMTRGGISNNQSQSILSNYLLENADSGKCQ